MQATRGHIGMPAIRLFRIEMQYFRGYGARWRPIAPHIKVSSSTGGAIDGRGT
jgi:hypothetical protein